LLSVLARGRGPLELPSSTAFALAIVPLGAS
jgi:hypothetical protein